MKQSLKLTNFLLFIFFIACSSFDFLYYFLVRNPTNMYVTNIFTKQLYTFEYFHCFFFLFQRTSFWCLIVVYFTMCIYTCANQFYCFIIAHHPKKGLSFGASIHLSSNKFHFVMKWKQYMLANSDFKCLF